ncbi:MAG: single-stranded DNA-specific DHH superfamily exonuclease [Patescibacteria group bacterium]|jgi:single-stranded DNA-specific DHH superfamily exonuclease
MLSQEKINEIRDHLESSANPLFLYDNDADGLCSFLVLRRALGRGKGVAIKSYPELNSSYLDKVEEFYADAVFVLDKAEISAGFIDGLSEKNIPLIWIDHHPSLTDSKLIAQTHYYNSYPSAEPTTFIAHCVFKRKNDLWLSMIGCISDVYTPSFAEQFSEDFPDLYRWGVDAFTSLHTSEIGKFALMLNFGLMDTTHNVLHLTKYLVGVTGPYDLLEENEETKAFHKKYRGLRNELMKNVERAESESDLPNGVFYYSYSGSVSMSSLLSNQLYFKHPDSLVIVAYKKSDRVNVSIRGIGAKKFTGLLVKDIDGASGGGHEVATGAMIPLIEVDKFEEMIRVYSRDPKA